MTIDNANVGSSTPAVVATGASGGTAITALYLCNNSTEAATVNVYACKTGEGANDGNVGDSTTNMNIIYRELTISAQGISRLSNPIGYSNLGIVSARSGLMKKPTSLSFC